MSEKLENDEIDLIELVQVLWKQKWKIIGSAVVCTAIAAGYAFTAKEQWTSKATVIAPKLANVESYISQRSEYANILARDFDANAAMNNLFNSFKTALFSNNTKKAFFEQSEWFKQYTSKNAKTDDAKAKLLNSLLENNLVITIPDLKKDPNALGITISFASETPSDAQKVLTDYLNFVNNTLLTEEIDNFKADITLKANTLEFQKDKLERNTESTREVQIQNLSTALEMAKSAGIKEYTKNISANLAIPEAVLGDAKIPFTDSKLSDGSYLFMLGEKYLKAQLDTLKNNPLIYPVDYYTMTKQITLLKGLEQKISKSDNVQGYYYLTSPDYPVTKDKPKKLLIMLVGMALGGLFSTFYFVIKFLLKNRD